MVKIDLRDRKILYELYTNSRQSLSQISRKVGLGKSVVHYKINKLQEKNVIKQFYTVIDAYKLGYIVINIYLTYSFTTPEIEKEIVDYIVKNKYTWFVGSIKGNAMFACFDLAISIWVKDLNDFQVFWDELLKRYRMNIQNHVVSTFFYLTYYTPSFLLLDKSGNGLIHKEIFNVSGGRRIETDETDLKIMRLLSTNARIPTTEIANNLNLHTETINNRIKRLLKSGIIQGFSIEIDFSKLNLHWFKANIELIDYSKRGEIINFVKSSPFLYRISKQAGFVDVELGFIVEKSNQFFRIIEKIYTNFPNSIRSYNYFFGTQVFKVSYMPGE